MSSSDEAGTQQAHGEEAASPRADFKDAIGWTALGVATLIGSITMDRLESQGINPYTVPGLLPGLLGIALILLGAAMAVRSWRRGALRPKAHAADPMRAQQRRRVGLTIALCTGYSVVLVGHGLPFWLASSIYVTASILLFQRLSLDEAERRLGLRAWAKALAIGVGVSLVISLVFEQVFLVRLP
ncbi:tripartite tricarboxylate transporter TctB family protein [Xenophilus sp.]|uniref:tripartite tricarboxylate transporter TctB family protein n=1 Tax=Xenophilus sp. TaxID=1873499 RepID=UPI0037DC113E